MKRFWMLCLVIVFILTACGVNGIDTAVSAEEEIAVPDTERPGATRFIVDIIDRTQLEGISTGTAMELFYADDEYEYYFSSIKSEYVMVLYNDASSEDVVTAFQNGRITIEDLDAFGIRYFKEVQRNN